MPQGFDRTYHLSHSARVLIVGTAIEGANRSCKDVGAVGAKTCARANANKEMGESKEAALEGPPSCQRRSASPQLTLCAVGYTGSDIGSSRPRAVREEKNPKTLVTEILEAATKDKQPS